VPVCGKICGRSLPCGPTENRHSCKIMCHSGPCPPCPLTTLLRCRCGRNEKDVPCVQLADLVEVLCERRCNKKRQCGR
jgi:transcriptional repressor NF-X1